MKRIVLFSLLMVVSTVALRAQDMFITKTGHSYFKSHTDAIDIDGNNHQVTSILNTKNGEIVFQMLIKSFKFTLATAEEHFNETYMESDKFPKASFKGIVTNLSEMPLNKNGKYTAKVKGDITIHGITKTIEQEGIVTVEAGKINASSTFTLNIDDFNIKVPKMVEERVAKVVEVKMNLEYQPYK